MKKILMVLILITIGVGLSHADTLTTQISIAVDALNDAIDKVNKDNSSISDLTNIITNYQQNVTNYQSQITETQARLSLTETDLLKHITDITAVALQDPPLPQAVSYCNSNPTNCVNWATVAMISGTACQQSVDCSSEICDTGVCQ